MGVARQAYLNQASAPADFLLYTHFQHIVKKNKAFLGRSFRDPTSARQFLAS